MLCRLILIILNLIDYVCSSSLHNRILNFVKKKSNFSFRHHLTDRQYAAKAASQAAAVAHGRVRLPEIEF